MSGHRLVQLNRLVVIKWGPDMSSTRVHAAYCSESCDRAFPATDMRAKAALAMDPRRLHPRAENICTCVPLRIVISQDGLADFKEKFEREVQLESASSISRELGCFAEDFHAIRHPAQFLPLATSEIRSR